jgi:phage gp29-like protein
MKHGLYVTPTDFVSFAEQRRAPSLSTEIASRARSMDAAGLAFTLPNPDPVLKRQGKDLRVYRELRSDAHVGGCIRRRKASVKALERRIVAGKAGARATRRAEDVLGRLNMDRVLNEMLDGVLFGWQPLELMWGLLGGAMVPLDVVGKPGEWFTFDGEAQLRFLSRGNPRGEELEPRKFLLARQEASYANPYGFADLSMCFWPTVFKRGGLKFWVTFTEKYGTPWLVGKQPRGTAPAEVEGLLDKLEAMIQDAVAAIPDDASIEVLEAAGKGASAELYERLLMFCRSEVSIALLGQNQSTEASSTHASATAGLQVTQDIRDGDARMVEGALNQLLRWVTDLNEGEAAPSPTVELFEEEQVNTEQAERDKTLGEAGVQFTRKYWLRTYKLEESDLVPEAAPGARQPAAPVQFAAGDAPPAGDAIDQAVQAELAGWQPLMQPMVQPLQALLDDAARRGLTAAQVIDLLPQALAGMDDAALADALTRLSFAARAAAEANPAEAE